MYSKVEYIRGGVDKIKYRKIPGDCQWFCFQFRQPGLPNPSFTWDPTITDHLSKSSSELSKACMTCNN